MRLAYPAIFTPFSDGQEGYVVEFPDLPGCVTEGFSMAEALFMAEDAASGWILGELEEKNRIPAASDIRELKSPKEGFLSMVLLNIDANSKALPKTLAEYLAAKHWNGTTQEDREIDFGRPLK